MMMLPISSSSFSIGTWRNERAPASLISAGACVWLYFRATSATWTTCLVSTRRRTSGRNRSGRAAVVLRTHAVRRAWRASGVRFLRTAVECQTWLRRCGLRSPISPGTQAASSPGEFEMTCSTSEVAVCCSRASASSRLYFSSCCSRSARDLRVRPTGVLALVPVERSLRLRVPLFAPLRDKVTSSAQSVVPFRSGGPPSPKHGGRQS